MSRAAAFLDRDGTLNARPPDHHYVCSASDFAWLPASAEGAARLAHAGFELVVVSNQRGVARGVVTDETLRAIEVRIQSELERHGCRVAAFRYCPHELDDGCECRKPQPGMLLALARELGLDLRRSWMIGDAESDVLAGRAAGCHTARIAEPETPTQADVRGRSLLELSTIITSSPRD